MSHTKPKRTTLRTVLKFAATVFFLPFAAASPANKDIPAPDVSKSRTNIAVTATTSAKSEGQSSVVNFTVTVVNDGPDDAHGVLLETISSPRVLAQLGKRSIRASNGAVCHNKILVCEIGVLAAHSSVKIQVVTEVTVSPPATLGLEFRIASDTIDTIPFDNHYYSSAFLSGDQH